MSRRHLVALSLGLGLCGCSATRTETRPGGTVRLFGGQRVVGRYVSPSAYEHYIRAQLAADEGRHEDAALALAQAVASDGTSAYLRTRLGEELLGLGRLDEARESLEAALRYDPDFAEAHVELGRIALRLGDARTGEAEFRRALELDRGCEEAYLALGQTFRDRGELGKADAVYHSMVDRMPDSAAAHVQLGRMALGRGEPRVAEQELRRAAQLEPSSLAIEIELGRVLLSAGRPTEAEHELRAALLRSGRDPRVAELLVSVLLSMGKRDEASAVVDALDTGTSSRERLLQIGWLLLNQGRGERALAVAEGVLAGADFPAAHLLRGGALAALGRTDEAAVELGAIPPEEPEFIAAQLRLSRALSEAGRGREAIELLAGALSRTQPRPQSDALATQLAELIERGGDRQRARRVLDDALKLHPTSDALCYALGGLLDRGGEGDKALEVVGAILERSPDNAEAHNFIGWNLTERNLRLKEALRHLERAHALRPTSGEIADSLGWLYFKLDRAEEATRLLEVAARLLPEAPEVLGHLGEAYLKRDDRPRALAAFRQALAHSPEPRVRQALEQKLLFLEEGRVGAR